MNPLIYSYTNVWVCLMVVFFINFLTIRLSQRPDLISKYASFEIIIAFAGGMSIINRWSQSEIFISWGLLLSALILILSLFFHLYLLHKLVIVGSMTMVGSYNQHRYQDFQSVQRVTCAVAVILLAMSYFNQSTTYVWSIVATLTMNLLSLICYRIFQRYLHARYKP